MPVKKHGIDETKELMTGVFALATMFIDVFKDGVQFMDAVTIVRRLMDDPRYVEAIKGIEKVPAEAMDIDGEEFWDLLKHGMTLSEDMVRELTGYGKQ